MLIFFSDGRLGNQIFQFMFLKTISKRNELIVCFNMKVFFETFDFNKHYVLHTSNKYICYLFQNIFISRLIKPLCKKGIITYILQKRDNNFLPLPEWEERSGLLSNIRYVNTDFFQSETFLLQKRHPNYKLKMNFC